MFLFLGLVKKHNSGFRRIYHLSYPSERSVNAGILKEYSNIKYTILNNIIRIVKTARKHAVIFKKYIKNIFRNIPVTINNKWLLGFL